MSAFNSTLIFVYTILRDIKIRRMRFEIGNRFDIAKCCIRKVDKFNSPMYKYHQSFNNAQLSIYSHMKKKEEHYHYDMRKPFKREWIEVHVSSVCVRACVCEIYVENHSLCKWHIIQHTFTIYARIASHRIYAYWWYFTQHLHNIEYACVYVCAKMVL